MERHEEMLSPEEQYAQLAPTLDTDGFSLYAAAEEITGLKVYEEFPYDRATKLEEIGYSVMTMSPALFRQMNQTELLAA